MSLLHSYRNPAHETQAQAVGERAAPASRVLLQRGLADHPRIRAHHHGHDPRLRAAARGALSRLAAGGLQQAGVPAGATVTKSNGGVMTAELGKSDCVQMILSGTAAGVIGAAYVAEPCGLERCHEPRHRRHLAPTSRSSSTAAAIRRRRDDRRLPDLHPDRLGDLDRRRRRFDRLGRQLRRPQGRARKAPARRPGPACYGRGGTRPTITDAFAVCGFIGHADLGYDAVSVDRRAGARRRRDDRRQARARARAGRRGDHPRRGLRHVLRGQQARLALRASIRATSPCWRSAAPGPMLGCFLARELGMRAGPGADGARRAVRAGRAGRRRQERLHQHRLSRSRRRRRRCRASERFRPPRARRARLDARRAGLSPASTGCTSRPTCATSGQSFEIEVPLDADAIAAATSRQSPRPSIASTTASTATPTRARRSRSISLRLVVAGKPPKPDSRRGRCQRRARPARQADRGLSRRQPSAGAALPRAPTCWPGIASPAPASWRRRTARPACRPASPPRSTHTATSASRAR